MHTNEIPDIHTRRPQRTILPSRNVCVYNVSSAIENVYLKNRKENINNNKIMEEKVRESAFE